MEINTNIGAATYAMKTAMELPNIVMNLVLYSAGKENQTLGMNTPIPQPVNISSFTGKGKNIDLVA